MFRVTKFKNTFELEHHLNGGVIGGTSRHQFYDVVGKTLVFTAPGAFTVTFAAGSGPGGLLTFQEVCAQVLSQSTATVAAWAEGEHIALRMKAPAAGSGVTVTNASTALAALGFAAGSQLRGRVHSHAEGTAAPYLVSVTTLGTSLVLTAQE